MTTNSGGPAFPCERDEFGNPVSGMTLRDYGAFKALQGFCANPAIFASNGMNGWDLVNCTEEQLCQVAYRIADAALKVRSE